MASRRTIRVDLRSDIRPSTAVLLRSKDDRIKIYAPSWVKEAQALLLPSFSGHTVSIFGHRNQFFKQIPIGPKQLTLTTLQLLSRNECSNTSGAIAYDNYPSGIPKSTILATKDLVRHCVIIGKTETVAYGGYPRGSVIPQVDPVYILDLAALQFQKPWNSGRLVLYNKDLPTGDLDELIFSNTGNIVIFA